MSMISPLKVYSVGFNGCKDREQKGACFRKREMKKKRDFSAPLRSVAITHMWWSCDKAVGMNMMDRQDGSPGPIKKETDFHIFTHKELQQHFSFYQITLKL